MKSGFIVEAPNRHGGRACCAWFCLPPPAARLDGLLRAAVAASCPTCSCLCRNCSCRICRCFLVEGHISKIQRALKTAGIQDVKTWYQMDWKI